MASITKCGDGWRVRIRRSGARSISKNFPNKTQARRWAEQMEGDLTQLVDFGIPEKGVTLGDFLDRYLREVTPRKKGYKQETIRINTWKEHPWATKNPLDLRASEIADWRREQEAEDRAPSTIRNDMNLLSHVYTTAISEWGYENLQNPFKKVVRPKMRQGRERRLMPGEEAKLLKVAEGYSSNIRSAIILALETGMRRGELAKLRPEWLRGRVLYLPDTKNSEPRGVPLSKRALAEVEALQPQSTSTLLNMTPDSISHRFTEVCKDAKIKGLRFHDLRHEATSRLFEKGLSMMEVASITGHKSLVMLRRYTHLSAAGLVDKLG